MVTIREIIKVQVVVHQMARTFCKKQDHSDVSSLKAKQDKVDSYIHRLKQINDLLKNQVETTSSEFTILEQAAEQLIKERAKYSGLNSFQFQQLV